MLLEINIQANASPHPDARDYHHWDYLLAKLPEFSCPDYSIANLV
jgi:hypothetical protein